MSDRKVVPADLLAHASVRASTIELATLRRAPGPLGGVAVPPSRLKHTDDQTVVGVVAVLRAIEASGLDPVRFGDWGVMAASRCLGRTMFNGVFPQFQIDGAWGVSPNLVANHSLHSVSGMISLVLKAHGPNLGVGGGPGEEFEAFLSAATFLADGSVPGVWVVLTGTSEQRQGNESSSEFEALAFALAAPSVGCTGFKLGIAPGTLIVEAPPGRTADEIFHVGSMLWRVDQGPFPATHHGERIRWTTVAEVEEKRS